MTSSDHATPVMRAIAVDEIAPPGKYIPAILSGTLNFVSGQGPLNPDTTLFENYDVDHQTRLTLENLRRILASANSSLTDVVKVAVHLQIINDVATHNATNGEYVDPPRPARTTVQAVLGAGTSMEIDVISIRGCDDVDGGRP